MSFMFRIFIFALASFLSGCDFFLSKEEKSLRVSLPNQIGKNLLIKKCASCHGLEKTLMRRSKDQKFWQDTILFMNKVYGMQSLNEEDKKILIEYLTHL